MAELALFFSEQTAATEGQNTHSSPGSSRNPGDSGIGVNHGMGDHMMVVDHSKSSPASVISLNRTHAKKKKKQQI